MKRRSLLKSVAGVPVAAALAAPVVAQTQAPQAPAEDSLKLDLTQPSAVGEPVRHFFSPEQFAALENLAEIMVPSFAGRPGAKMAGAAEFLDFYISQSSAGTQQLYRSGLDRLNASAMKAHGKAFAAIQPEQAAALLQPATEPWTYDGPKDVFARFLTTAKGDLMRATVNSRPYAAALSATSRSSAGIGYYWFPVE